MDAIRIGISGYGFVGNAIFDFFNDKPEYMLFVYDKYKNINIFNVLLNTDIIFICLPTNLEKDKNTYEMTEINSTIELLDLYNYRGIIIIKSTILPDYCQYINNLYPSLKILNNPEFLSARSASEDFKNQKHIVIGYTEQSKDSYNILVNIYKNEFPNAEISVLKSEEASLVKLGCNSFYATKIQFFTELYLLSDKLNVNYENIKNTMLKNGWINPMHTQVPGQDGKISYGGLCLPKDTVALSEFIEKNDVSNLVLKAVIKDNLKTRSYNLYDI